MCSVYRGVLGNQMFPPLQRPAMNAHIFILSRDVKGCVRYTNVQYGLVFFPLGDIMKTSMVLERKMCFGFAEYLCTATYHFILCPRVPTDTLFVIQPLIRGCCLPRSPRLKLYIFANRKVKTSPWNQIQRVIGVHRDFIKAKVHP